MASFWQGAARRPRILLALAVAGLLASSVVVAAPSGEREISEAEAEAAGCVVGWTRELRPVCDSEGKIHGNPGIFRYNQCIAKLKGRELSERPMEHCDPHYDL